MRVTSSNDPCSLLLGSGWRLPTKTEWEAVALSENWVSASDSYNSVLKLHYAGDLYSSGALEYGGSRGYYSSSTERDNDEGYYYSINGSKIYDYYKSRALPVRCVLDTIEITLPVLSNVEIPEETITDSSAYLSATIVVDGGSAVIERGFCWNTSGNPTVLDTKIVMGSGTGKNSCSF